MKKLILIILIIITSLLSGFLLGKFINRDIRQSAINPEETIEESVEVKDSIDEKANEILKTMSLEEKIGQMFLIRCNEYTAIDDINEYKVSGFILFDENIDGENKESLSSTISTYQTNSPIKLFIAIDEEGGTVNRLSWYSEFRSVPFYSPQELYNEGGYPLIITDTKEKATLLKSIGINMNLAPVADISTDPNDYIYPRTFGKSAEETAEYIKTVVKTMKENNIGSTLKHFPGYGDNLDTHSGISIDNRSYESFLNNDFIPFKAGVDAGADSILVSHNIINSIDENLPASLSKKVHDVIRNELNFNGVIMTDDLQMSAIKDYIGEVNSAIFAVNSGNDLIISSDYEVQIPSIIEAVKNGDIKEKVIDEAVLKVLNLKLKLGII
ncbi:glycoside hydrolase family 3 N-terminal domain-containing protein [Clostridium nigeriense]|uniref:glycoside hydrolase family 3 N-terminal domain-containing protein n=1 Tax=Clostridium nigeriense TaxID=1805470 RepID=UPI003D3481D4